MGAGRIFHSSGRTVETRQRKINQEEVRLEKMGDVSVPDIEMLYSDERLFFGLIITSE